MSSSSITNADHNAFARGLAKRFSARVVGLDEASVRLVEVRPADQILGGFLTPSGDGDAAESADDDLPRDSPYEQTAMGFEWLVPANRVGASDALALTLTFHVYVRRLPEFEELGASLVWKTERKEGVPPEEYALVPFVWTREGPFVLHHHLSLAKLLNDRLQVVTLAAETREALATIGGATGRLFPGRQPLRLLRPDVATKPLYDAWVAARENPAGSLVEWLPQLDARVTPVPLDPGVVRLALRVVNRTGKPTTTAQRDFIDPNLYGVHLKASLPTHCHRRSTFNELPASYRYDRTMWAVGINAQAACGFRPSWTAVSAHRDHSYRAS